MAKLKYRVRVLLGDQELVLLVPAAPETTVGELQTEVLARARRQGIIGSACAFSVDGALLDELDSVEDTLEVEQPIDARLSPLRECSWSAADLAALAREGFSPALRHTIVDIHASLAAFRRSPDGSRLMPSRVTPAKRSAPEADEDCVAAPAPADEDESDAGESADEDASVAAPAPAPAPADDDEDYVWPAAAPHGAALVGSRIRVWWPHDRAWFAGKISAFDGTKLYEITYTDGSLWDEELAERRWELLDERSLKAHEKELLRVERLIAAGELSKHQGGAAGSVYARFYELTRMTGQSPWKQQLLREQTRLIIDAFLDAPVADAADDESDGEESDSSDDAPPRRPPTKRARVASESGEVTKPRTRRGRGSAEVVSERDFSELWDLLKGKGWKVLPKPQYIASGDPRTWMWCAPEIVEPQNDSGYYKLRGRDAGVVGESIFLDKDDLWVWAVRKGLVAAPPRRRARVDSSDDESAPPPRRRARTERRAPPPRATAAEARWGDDIVPYKGRVVSPRGVVYRRPDITSPTRDYVARFAVGGELLAYVYPNRDAALEDLEEEAATVPTFCVCGSTDEPKVFVRCRGRGCRAGGLLHRYCAGLGADESASRDWRCALCREGAARTISAIDGGSDVEEEDTTGAVSRNAVAAAARGPDPRAGTLGVNPGESWPYVVLDRGRTKSPIAAQLALDHDPDEWDVVLFLKAPVSQYYGAVPRTGPKRGLPFDPAKSYSHAGKKAAAAFACTLLPLSHAARLTAALREAKLESDGAPASPDAARLPLVGRLLRDGDVERRVVDADATQAWCVEWPPPSDGSPARRVALPLATAYVQLRAHDVEEVRSLLDSRGGSKIAFRYKTEMCGQCRHCLDNPKFGGTGKARQACILRQRERAERLEQLRATGGAPRDRIDGALRSCRGLGGTEDDEIPCENRCGRTFATLGGMRKHARNYCPARSETGAEEAVSARPPPAERRRDPKVPCTICFAVVAEADAVFGSDVCSHVFHRECIEGWARECAERPHNVATRRGVRISCPNCKKGKRVVAGPVESDDDSAPDSGGSDGDESDVSELMAEAPALGGATRSSRFGVGAHVESTDDASDRGVLTSVPVGSMREVTTTTGAVVFLSASKLKATSLTDEEAARCVRPASQKDYVQARIDGAIRLSHGGREFKNRFTASDGTERRQFEVSGIRVRCALCPDSQTCSSEIDIPKLLVKLKSHCGEYAGSSQRPSALLHRERLLAAASPRTVLGVSLAQARVLAEAATAGRLIPVREESSSAPNL